MATSITFQQLNLSKPLLSALETAGFTHPTTIQHRVFPIAMSGKDVCGIAQTGTGKTLAYLLPCLRQWTFNKQKTPQILVIVPTRELVTQIVTTIQQVTAFMQITTVGVYGGTNINTQALALANGVDILVATPGRLYDLAMNGAFKVKTIKKVVIDEMDELLNLGFRTQLKNMLDLLPAKRQNLLFSATVTPDVAALIDVYFNQPVWVEAAPAGTPVDRIEQALYEVPNFNTKVHLLKWLLQSDASMSKVLVFTASKQLADDLHEQLAPDFADTMGVIHSNKEQNHRFNTVRQFRSGAYRMVIATDIVARGIDIDEVTHVINFDLPNTPEQYLHRIGRTGRLDKTGIAISFVTEKEKVLLAAIETQMQREVLAKPLPAEVTISNVLTDAEKPKVQLQPSIVLLPKREASGPAFHPKSAKNSKVNVRKSRKDVMQKKYGKPQKRKSKK